MEPTESDVEESAPSSADLPAPITVSGPALRARAEKVASERRAVWRDAPESLSAEQARTALHELGVHQIELEIQNEELRRAHAELELLRGRYFDLYDLAPVGYVTMSESGLIQEANLTAGILLGVARRGMVKVFLSQFILVSDQDTYYMFRRVLAETKRGKSVSFASCGKARHPSGRVCKGRSATMKTERARFASR